MIKEFDAVIIGGGAAGLMCAAVAGKRGRKVLLIEHSKKLGEKIRISGGGRCNFTNIYTASQNFLSKNSRFCVSALQRFNANDFLEMVNRYEIKFHEKTLGQLFCDFSSQQIIDMFLEECKQGGVEIALESRAKNIIQKSGGFSLNIESGQKTVDRISCKSLVIATGGLSIPKIGATSFGYDLARKFGLKIVKTRPALVPLMLSVNDLQDLKELAGVSFDGKVICELHPQESGLDLEISENFKSDNFYVQKQKNGAYKISFRESVLITHRGLSGPVILQISSYLPENGAKITINMLPKINVFEMLLEEKKRKPKQEIITILTAHLPKRLASYVTNNCKAQGWIADTPNQKLQEIAHHVNFWNLKIAGSEGYAKAEVTAGGVDVDEISSKTFECKNIAGLYFIGEVLDVTGHLGGFNFQFAWASAAAAGDVV